MTPASNVALLNIHYYYNIIILRSPHYAPIDQSINGLNNVDLLLSYNQNTIKTLS